MKRRDARSHNQSKGISLAGARSVLLIFLVDWACASKTELQNFNITMEVIAVLFSRRTEVLSAVNETGN